MLKFATAAVVAAAAIVAAAPATAAVTPTVYTSAIGDVNVPPTFTFSNGVTVQSGAVQADYTFNLLSAFTMNASSFTSAAMNPFTFSSITLFDSANKVLSTSNIVDPVGRSGATAIGLEPVQLTAGQYRISVLGNATGTASIGSSVTFAAAVPEPATWAMMLVGFGMVGAASRYRRRNTAVAYA